MRKSKLFDKKNMLLMILAIGLAGTVLFFPVNIQNRYTCLYHRLFVSEHTHASTTDAGAEPEAAAPSLLTSEKTAMSEVRHDELLHGYLAPFGLLWWGSLVILALGIYGLRKFYSLQWGSPATPEAASGNRLKS